MIELNIDRNKRYLLACSFGPDSMALFHLLVKNKYDFACAIVNYHLRVESNSEVIDLKKYAAIQNVKVYDFDVKEKITKNVEATCREIRYKFFNDICTRFHYDAVLIAHNQDDVIETYLLQKERQIYPNFYGISNNSVIYNVEVIRPLLSYKKSDLKLFCDNNFIPYAIDKSNFDVSIKRNKIRHNVVSKLSDNERREIIDKINLENNKLSQLLSSIDYGHLFEIKYFLSLSFILQCYSLNYAIKNVNPTLFISKENVGQIVNVLKSSKPNGQFQIKKGLYLFKEYDVFEFGSSTIKQADYSYLINSPTILNTPYFYLNFKSDSSNRNVSLSDYPLTIRNVKNNDFIIINGYKVKVNRLMIDWKVPFRKRSSWPVILNKKNEIIYIPRYHKDFEITDDLNFYVK